MRHYMFPNPTPATRQIAMHLTDYLRSRGEPIPQWLDEFENGDTFEIGQFFASRVVYYPGSGTDGQPVKLFGSSHSAHCFVYADNGIVQGDLEAELARPTRHFRGYRKPLQCHSTVSFSRRRNEALGWICACSGCRRRCRRNARHAPIFL